MTRTKYTKDVLEDIVKDCVSYREVISKLGLKYSGGSHMILLDDFSLNTERRRL